MATRKKISQGKELFEPESFDKIDLSKFVENPDNPQTVTDEAFDRLVEKIKANPNGLRAHRIAFVTDHPAGERVVISGNKRLRALKKIYGENGRVYADWFQNVTWMTLEQRKAFIVAANVNEGEWDVEKLLEQYDRDELDNLFDAGEIGDILAEITQGGGDNTQPSEGEKPSRQVIAPNQEIDTGSFEDKMTLKIELSSSKYEAVVAKLREICADDLGKALTEALHV